MGVGTPSNLIESIARGIDMFDCVLPTRNARHGLLYTWNGVINIKNAKWKQDFSPLDDKSLSPLSQRHSRAYVRHLFHAGEHLGAQIASLHNTVFFLELVRTARQHILEGTFNKWKEATIPRLTQRL